MRFVRSSYLAALCMCYPGLLACSTGSTEPEPLRDGAEITEVNHTPVKEQPIGNCWIYASLGWVESLEQRATGTTPDYSEAYFTMQDWRLKLASEFELEDGKISTGGAWSLTQQELAIFGLMKESDFVTTKTVTEAEEAFNQSLATGALATAEARLDQELVYTELFAAFGVTQATQDHVLSEDRLIYPSAVQVEWPNATTLALESHTLADALEDWQEVPYPASAAERRKLQIRVQRAMHGGAPVVVSWVVDFNALEGSTFSLDTLKDKGKGSQGGHMSLMYDYQATNVPGFGTLKAGENETRAEALAAALSPQTKIEFFRIKNSWGDTQRPDDAQPTDAPNGYYDLEQTYLDGPIEKEDGTGKTTPWMDVVLPAGF